ncbi:hypothetical protein WA026_000314 [Henosepilachna vigintioctopunctata]|uniref:Uncharacterized protein n=1 Tax=Henosepilachna vigintioctopunctata TaxID=420089 RepID=A0AAW1V6V7_9CUCU
MLTVNTYEPLPNDPDISNSENIYETIEDVRQQMPQANEQPIYNPVSEVASCSTYGRIGNAYGRIDILGHGIGRIERHLSSSCGSIDSNHYYTLESFQPSRDSTGRISKVSIQWLLANKWLPLWVANTDNGRDYRIIDFLLAQGENEEVYDGEVDERSQTDEGGAVSSSGGNGNGQSPSSQGGANPPQQP